MQKISLFFSLYIAKTTPQERAAGMAGGTQIVKRSSERSSIKAMEVPALHMNGMVKRKPTIATMAIIPTNFNPSL